MATKNIQVTKNYRLFERSADNRPLDVTRHKKLKASMEKYGFLRCFPIVVYRDKQGRLVVKDGQHRLTFAEYLGLPVYYVEESVDFDVSEINCTPKTWTLTDFALNFAENGIVAYREGIEFSKEHQLPVGTAFALLAGVTSYSNCADNFTSGKFEVKDRPWAQRVASMYGPLVRMSPAVKRATFIEACMAVGRVQWFDLKRLLENAGRCRELLVPYSTRDACLEMLDRIYNFGRQKRFPLKFEAIEEMSKRNAAKKKAGAKSERNGAP